MKKPQSGAVATRRSGKPPGPPRASLVSLVELAANAGAILVAFAIAMVGEMLIVAVVYARLLAGPWETAAIRSAVMPIAASFLVPVAISFALLGRVARRTPTDPVARRLLAGLVVVANASVAWGVSNGRHLSSPTLRTAFVLVVALGAGAIAFALVPVLARRRASSLTMLGLPLIAAAWLADVFVLPRLYPAFHGALFVLVLAGIALVAQVIPTRGRLARIALSACLALGALATAFAPRFARELAGYDNLRIVLVDRLPILGRAVRWAASVVPPAADEAATASSSSRTDPTSPATTLAPMLDFRGRDVLLISIDALRADHVSAYGYHRRTTPQLDRLAAEGVRFSAAYSPTPHTSYAVTSMMTGKYMRPLLSLGLGADSETWAGVLRQYGYRTAAFYPPAVFFIDETSFVTFRDRGLDFEYRKVEFADADKRVEQVDAYLAKLAPEQPAFLWTHFFEPHEPYVMHPGREFGAAGEGKPIDAYDSEIAAADAALGTLVDHVRKARPHVVVLITADHGEEFGDHGGRYHGTSVYDEQVRVPLVIVGEGIAPRVVTEPVQTIDLLPTLLSALHIPRPARLRGRDLGPLLVAVEEGKGAPNAASMGFAFSETEDHTLVAEGAHRLLCDRRLGACTLYDVNHDPNELRDVSRSEPDVFARLRKRGAELARSHGRLEQGESAGYPEALRRALLGDREASLEVASLLDDVRLDLRRAAARALFELADPATHAFAWRAYTKDDDAAVKNWAALTLLRLAPVMEAPGSAYPAAPQAHVLELLAGRGGGGEEERFAAALALAEARDARGMEILIERLRPLPASPASGTATPIANAAKIKPLSFADERAVVAALGSLRDKRAVPALVRALDDVRLRPLAAAALGTIGDPSARSPLLKHFGEERYVSMRTGEARALLALGARQELEAPLRKFAGVPDPWLDALGLATAAGLTQSFKLGQRLATEAFARRVYFAPNANTATSDGGVADAGSGEVTFLEVPAGEDFAPPPGVRQAFVVRRTDELPPPAPVPWVAAAGERGGSTP